MTSVAIVGGGSVGSELTDLARKAGLAVSAAATSGEPPTDVELREARRADVVLEVSADDLHRKRDILARVSGVCRNDVPIATLTHSSPVLSLALGVSGPQRVVGFNTFPSPAATAVVEVVPHADTTDWALDRVSELWRMLGKSVLRCGDRPGLIGARLMLAYVNDAARLMASAGLDRETIDTAMRLGGGLPRGPFEVAESIGVSLCVEVVRALYARGGDVRLRPAPLLEGLARDPLDGDRGPPHLRSRPSDAMDANEHAPIGGGEIERVGVLGTGVVGSGVVEVAAEAGYEVMCWGRSPGSLDRGRVAVARSTARQEEKVQGPGRSPRHLDRIRWTTDLRHLARCDLVVEAVVEDREVKERLLNEIGRLLAPGAVLSTSTSSLSVSALGRASGRPGSFLGLHFFNPVRVMRLVELVPTPEVDRRAVDVATRFVGRLGKTSIVAPDTPGFIVNRLLFPLVNDALQLVEDGYATPKDIDAVVEGAYGHPLGPLALADLVGLDVTARIIDSLGAADPLMRRPGPLLRDFVDAGALGRKSTRGFRYNSQQEKGAM